MGVEYLVFGGKTKFLRIPRFPRFPWNRPDPNFKNKSE